MDLSELVLRSHKMAKEKGWWDPGTEKTALECHMLIVSELAEATEAVGKGEKPFWLNDRDGNMRFPPILQSDFIREALHMGDHNKPEGEAVELADAVIRIADWFGRHGWDLNAVVEAKMAYNATRPHRHGGKLK